MIELTPPPTPELDKAAAASERAKIIGEFLDWCLEEKIQLAQQHDIGGIVPIEETRNDLLDRYFSIDVKKCAEERKAVLEFSKSSGKASGCKYGTPECKCCHYVDLGACTTYERGANGMCVFCDHHEICHSKIGDEERRGIHNSPI